MQKFEVREAMPGLRTHAGGGAPKNQDLYRPGSGSRYGDVQGDGSQPPMSRRGQEWNGGRALAGGLR